MSKFRSDSPICHNYAKLCTLPFAGLPYVAPPVPALPLVQALLWVHAPLYLGTLNRALLRLLRRLLRVDRVRRRRKLQVQADDAEAVRGGRRGGPDDGRRRRQRRIRGRRPGQHCGRRGAAIDVLRPALDRTVGEQNLLLPI